jgi:hypothetical protein
VTWLEVKSDSLYIVRRATAVLETVEE